MSQANRVETMAEKLSVYCARAGVTNVGLVLSAYHLALEARLAQLRDVFHRDMLHPARTVLILLEQADCHDADVLAAGAVTESMDAALQAARVSIARTLGNEVAALHEEVPTPLECGENLLEMLLTASEPASLVALAERLDHARHLHFRERAAWAPFHREISEIYLPVAERSSPALARRFSRWATAFRRRLA